MGRLALSVDAEVADDATTWDEFCLRHGWFWHTTSWREYTLHYRPEAASRSLAFGVRAHGRLVAAMPLMIERFGDPGRLGAELSFGGGPCWAPAIDRTLTRSERAAVIDFAFETIEAKAGEQQANRATLQASPLTPDFELSGSEFVAGGIRAGYLDCSLNTRIVDLSLSDAELLADMSHGHRQSIVRAERTMRIWTSTADEDFDTYRRLHHTAAGRVTRPPQTFELMRTWLSTGHALVTIAEIEGKAAGAILVLVFGEGAYYASAANDPAFRAYPIGHGLQWVTIQTLRTLGIQRYETGTEHRHALLHSVPTEKEQAIGRFKARFGGYDVPLHRRERFFSGQVADQVIRGRVDSYLQTLSSTASANARA